jgi:hypothetical protein
MPRKKKALIPVERIEHAILEIRGHKVILDAELAQMYGVSTARLNEQVRRNLDRFPADFSFVLTQEEFTNLMSQFATSNSQWGGRRKLPRAFTEHGAVMAASVLNTPVAVAISIEVVRAFVRLRQLLISHEDLARKLEAVEARLVGHDEQFAVVFEAIQELMTPPKPPPKGRIGFQGAQTS